MVSTYVLNRRHFGKDFSRELRLEDTKDRGVQINAQDYADFHVEIACDFLVGRRDEPITSEELEYLLDYFTGRQEIRDCILRAYDLKKRGALTKEQSDELKEKLRKELEIRMTRELTTSCFGRVYSVDVEAEPSSEDWLKLHQTVLRDIVVTRRKEILTLEELAHIVNGWAIGDAELAKLIYGAVETLSAGGELTSEKSDRIKGLLCGLLVGASKKVKGNPNCTILLPGSCSSDCDFCFGKEAMVVTRDAPRDYVELVKAALLSLPPEFQSVSISGGEPTESRYLVEILRMLGTIKGRFKKVGLTTNGIDLLEALELDGDAFEGVLDFVNISRHDPQEILNRVLFKNTRIPSNRLLKHLIQKLGRVPVTLNRVIRSGFRFGDAMLFIQFAKDMGAVGVSFRKDVRAGMEPTQVEEQFVKMFGPGVESNCPVCRSRTHEILGLVVTWKSSVEEPSVEGEELFETIIHPDGKLYSDWKRKHRYVPSPMACVQQIPVVEPSKEAKTYQTGPCGESEERRPLTGHCGGGSSGRC